MWRNPFAPVRGLTPTFSPLPLGEAAWLLQGLYLVNLEQLRQGIPPISAALHRGPTGQRVIRYERRDREEHWRTLRDLWRFRMGDCEDLAAAVAAELTYAGIPARPVIYKVRPGLAHAVVQITAPSQLAGLVGLTPGTILDPSRTGGMGEP